jgi:transposase
LWKNPEGISRPRFVWTAKTSPRLYRAYLLTEGLRWVFTVKGEQGKRALDRWLAWAQRCRIEVFVELGRKVKQHLPAIHAAVEHGLSNGLVESGNTKIRLLTRIAYGFANAYALIALAMLALGGYRPCPAGRS